MTEPRFEPGSIYPSEDQSLDVIRTSKPLPPTPEEPRALRLRAFEQGMTSAQAHAWALAWKNLERLATRPFDADRLRADRADAVARNDAFALDGQLGYLQDLMHTMQLSRRVVHAQFEIQRHFTDFRREIESRVDDAVYVILGRLGAEVDAVARARKQVKLQELKLQAPAEEPAELEAPATKP